MIPQTRLDLQVSRIEDYFSKIGYTPILKNFWASHEYEIVIMQYTYKELPGELDEKEVDISVLRQWLRKEHPELCKAFTRNGRCEFYYVIEGLDLWAQEEFFKHVLKQNL
jgi:hypothetical protein